MESDKLINTLSHRDHQLGETIFHDACQHHSVSLLWRVARLMDHQPNSTILSIKNYEGKQCTHIITNCKEDYAADLMEIVLYLGADINGREGLGGFTPLHNCIWKKNYKLAKWLCQAQGIDVEAETWAGQTAYHMAYERKDNQMMEILRKFGAKCKPPSENDSE